MGKYQAYESYKNSGVEWLGDIPEHWEIWKVTHGFKNVGSGTTPKSDSAVFYDGDIPWITTSELRETVIKDTSQKITKEALQKYSALKLYSKGSVAIAMYGATIDRLGMLGIDATVNQACCVFSESDVFHLPFFYYWLSMHRPNLIALSAGGGQPNLSQDDLKQLRLSIPPLKEQKAIARFLDYKTNQIDALIAKKETLLEKLDEKRTALISHAVTKGLDANVPMKDSGIEWLGEIPEHWKVKRLRYTGSCQNGVSKGGDYFGSGYPFINYTDVYANFELPKVVSGLAQSTDADRINYSVKKGDIFFTRTSETIEEIGITSTCLSSIENAIFSGFLIRFRPFYNVLFEGFSKYYFRCQQHRLFFVKEMNLVTRASLSQDLLKRLPVLLPPISEQKEIVEYLERKTAEIDNQKAKIQEALALLKEYRTALITNAVTGKIDVRQVLIPRKSLVETLKNLEDSEEGINDVGDRDLLPLDDIKI